MLKYHKLMAMASKLEEEGIVTPNTEVEVSASVSVTPEEQEKIDEAVTEVEEVTQAEQDLDELEEQTEQLEEAEATLKAIRDIVKKDGIITPQLYDFLQNAGYLDVISSFQKKVAFPATEAISHVSVNKQYADAIVAGCEAGLRDTLRNIWDFIVKQWKKFMAWCDNIIHSVKNLPEKINQMVQKLRAINAADSSGNEDFNSKEQALKNLKKNPNKKNFAKFKKEAKAYHKEVQEDLRAEFEDIKAKAKEYNNAAIIDCCKKLEKKFFNSPTGMSSDNYIEKTIDDLIKLRDIVEIFNPLDSNAKKELQTAERIIKEEQNKIETSIPSEATDSNSSNVTSTPENSSETSADAKSVRERCLRVVQLFTRFGRFLYSIVTKYMANARKICTEWKNSGGSLEPQAA